MLEVDLCSVSLAAGLISFIGNRIFGIEGTSSALWAMPRSIRSVKKYIETQTSHGIDSRLDPPPKP